MFYLIFTYKPVTAEMLKYCESASDCDQVKASCCGCSSGGEDTCINNEYLERWNNSMEANCRSTACIQLYNCPEVASCQCINNTCVFRVQ